MRQLLCFLLAAATSCTVLAQGRGPGAIEYKTVAAALADLKARNSGSISIQGGYTVIDDKAGNAVWSFVPVGHPAYPAVVRRGIIVKPNGMTGIAMATLCQSGKTVCDKLVAEFEQRDAQVAKEVRAKAYTAQGVPVSTVEVERLGEDAYRLILTSFTSKTVQAGQQELQAKARQLCGTKSPYLGKYEYNLSESFRDNSKDHGHLLLKQQLSCGDGAAPDAGSPAASRVEASAGQIARVEQLTRQYFGAKDQQRYKEAYALLAPTQQDITPFARWQLSSDEFNLHAGAAGERTIKSITWYRDPPQAAPGLYAAVDFVSRFANLEIHCGYVAWHEQADGSFLIVREEENALDRTVAKNLKPGELDKVRTRFGCRD
jgi:hypothetical protein